MTDQSTMTEERPVDISSPSSVRTQWGAIGIAAAATVGAVLAILGTDTVELLGVVVVSVIGILISFDASLARPDRGRVFWVSVILAVMVRGGVSALVDTEGSQPQSLERIDHFGAVLAGFLIAFGLFTLARRRNQGIPGFLQALLFVAVVALAAGSLGVIADPVFGGATVARALEVTGWAAAAACFAGAVVLALGRGVDCWPVRLVVVAAFILAILLMLQAAGSRFDLGWWMLPFVPIIIAPLLRSSRRMVEPGPGLTRFVNPARLLAGLATLVSVAAIIWALLDDRPGEWRFGVLLLAVLSLVSVAAFVLAREEEAVTVPNLPAEEELPTGRAVSQSRGEIPDESSIAAILAASPMSEDDALPPVGADTGEPLVSVGDLFAATPTNSSGDISSPSEAAITAAAEVAPEVTEMADDVAASPIGGVSASVPGASASAIPDPQAAAERARAKVDAFDPLTGLANRSHLLSTLLEAVESTVEGEGEDATDRESAGFLLIGMNGLAAVRNEFGEAVAARVISELAYRIVRTVEPSDVAGRLGGDDFGVVMRRNDEDNVVAAASDLLIALLEPVRIRSESREVEISAGLAIGQLYEDAESVARRADQALLDATAAPEPALVIAP